MRVLVTGGAGYGGVVSVEALGGAGRGVVVLHDRSTRHRAADLMGAPLVTGTFRNPAAGAGTLIARRDVAVQRRPDDGTARPAPGLRPAAAQRAAGGAAPRPRRGPCGGGPMRCS